MAKVKPCLKSDEDSAVELCKSASESDQSPRENQFPDMILNLPTYYASESDFSGDESYDGPSSVSTSMYNMAQSFSAKSKLVPRRINVRIENPRSSARKGRKRSIEDDESLLEEELSRPSNKHQSKNAINARINRIKKKKYMQSIEDSLDAYKNECKRWQEEYRQKANEVQSLQNEVKYLKAVIQNESKLSQLVRNFSQRVNAAPRSHTKPVSLVKGTNLSQTTNVKLSVPHYCQNESSYSSHSDMLVNGSSIKNEFSDLDSDFLSSESDFPLGEDMTFESVFPSACDLLNFDLPEYVEESSLFSPDTFPDFAADSESSSNCEDVGICLHVSTVSGISLEFCPHCSKSSLPTELPSLMT